MNNNCSNPNTLIILRVDSNNLNGKFICVNSDISCNNLQIQVDKNPSKTILAFGCSEGKRFGMAYSKSDLIGNFFEFYTSQFKTCKFGAASVCAKNIKNLGKKSLRFLEIKNTSYLNDLNTNFTINPPNLFLGANNSVKETPNNNNCLSPIKKICQDSLDDECWNSQLYQYIGELSPTSSGSPLPNACKNTDLLNPDFKTCFKWIADNLIKFTLFPNITAIMNIQQLISNFQENLIINFTSLSNDTSINSQSLRNLEISGSMEIRIFKEDASTKDKYAVIPSEIYSIPNDIMNIDGSTPLESVDIISQALIVIDGNTVPLKGEITSSYLNSVGGFTDFCFSFIFLIIFIILI